MSSIATITDPNMLEYHRFRGSDTMVFWRLGLKRFTKFDEGDLVFFIDRRHRHPKTQEKGIIGFGRCNAIGNKPLRQAWKLYEQQLGYETEDSFREAVRYYRKEDDTLPQRIQCIELDEMVLFQYPVFLSEVGFEVSERLESFTYLEKEGEDITSNVLNLGESMGIDPWYSMQNHQISMNRFNRIKQEQAIRRTLADLPEIVTYRDANIIKKHTQGVLFEGLFYYLNDSELILYYTNIHDISTLFSLYGIQGYLQNMYKEYQIKTLIYLKNPNESIQKTIQALNLLLVKI